MLGLQGLLLIGRHTLVAENVPSLLLSPSGGKVRLTLVAGVWLFRTGTSCGSSWTQITYKEKYNFLKHINAIILLELTTALLLLNYERCKGVPTPSMHFQEFLHHLLQTQQVDELIIGC